MTVATPYATQQQGDDAVRALSDQLVSVYERLDDLHKRVALLIARHAADGFVPVEALRRALDGGEQR